MRSRSHCFLDSHDCVSCCDNVCRKWFDNRRQALKQPDPIARKRNREERKARGKLLKTGPKPKVQRNLEIAASVCIARSHGEGADGEERETDEQEAEPHRKTPAAASQPVAHLRPGRRSVMEIPAVGQRIRVWWTLEQQWYFGACVQVDPPPADGFGG